MSLLVLVRHLQKYKYKIGTVQSVSKLDKKEIVYTSIIYLLIPRCSNFIMAANMCFSSETATPQEDTSVASPVSLFFNDTILSFVFRSNLVGTVPLLLARFYRKFCDCAEMYFRNKL